MDKIREGVVAEEKEVNVSEEELLKMMLEIFQPKNMPYAKMERIFSYVKSKFKELSQDR